MNCTFKQLCVFDAVASSGNLGAAAKSLSITKSAASMSLGQLEKALGCSLFERRGHTMALTCQGVWLRPKVKQIMHVGLEIESGINDMSVLSGKFGLGSSYSPAVGFVPRLVSTADVDFPELILDIDVDISSSLVGKVLNYDLDMAIVESVVDDPRLSSSVLYADELVIVASSINPLSKRESISPSHLESSRWVLRKAGAGSRVAFEQHMSALCEGVTIWREYDYAEVIKQVVLKTDCLTCLPRGDVARELETGQLVELPIGERLNQNVSLIWRKDVNENQIVNAIKRLSSRVLAMK